MFSSSSVSTVIKENPFEIYNHVQTQFLTIKNLNSFQTYTIISSNDLIIISNILTDCVDQLGDVSALYISKINNSNISVLTVDQLQKMHQLHNELIETIKKFNLISLDITNNIKEIHRTNYTQDIINYTHWDIINRYKFIILEIIDSVKKLNVYVELVKNKIN